MSLYYYPGFNWVDGCEITVINTGKIVRSFREFTNEHLDCGDNEKWFEFSSISWPIDIDIDKFAVDNTIF